MRQPATGSKPAPPPASAPVPFAPHLPAWQRTGLTGALTVALILIAYLPALHNGFIWDDDMHLTENPHLVGLAGLKAIWTTEAARICPLVLTSFWVERALWGLNPWPYHLVTILMHAAGSVILWRLLRRLNVCGAWFGAVLWALHPVSVESVAWITEMKNTQSGLFYLLAIWSFVKWRQQAGLPGRDQARAAEKYYALALLGGAAAMASKSSTVVLPLVLGLCAWWVEGCWRWRNALRIAPFFLFSVLAGAVSMWTQKLEGAADAEYVRSWPERVATAGPVVWFYLAKLLWPHPLIFIYPRWTIDASRAVLYLPSAAVLALLLFLCWKRQGWGRPWFMAFAYFLIALLPVLGLLDHYFLRFSFVGDHFQYLASIGPLALAGAGLTAAMDFVAKGNRLAKATCLGMLLLAPGTMTWERTHVYADSETLWLDTLAKNPACWMAHNNLGECFLDQGRIDEAMDQYGQALRLKPDYALAHGNLGGALLAKGRIDAAIGECQEALRLEPDLSLAHNNLGNARLNQGRLDEATREFREAIRLQPDSAPAHNNLGIALRRGGQYDESIRECQEALRLKPDYVEARNNLGNALLYDGRIDEAISQYQEALRLKPDSAAARENLTRALELKNSPTGR